MDIDSLAAQQQEVTPMSIAKRHDTLWFPDGNVVLATNTFLFRVHKSLLAFQSSVFRDMFAFPTTEDANIDTREIVGIVPEQYEGLPVVSLQDEGSAVEHLLFTICDPRYVPVILFHRSGFLTFVSFRLGSYYNTHQALDDKFEALMRLSFKYDFRGIRANVMEHLSRIHPTSLEEFEGISDSMRQGRNVNTFNVLKCAIEVGVDELFPSLYYACADKDPYELRKAVPDTPAGRNALFHILTGRAELRYGVQHIMSIWMGLTENCVALHQLSDHQYEDVSWESHTDEHFRSVDLRNVSGALLVNKLQYRSCVPCEASIEKDIEDERKRVWNKIPDYFGLGSWDIAKPKLKTWMEENA